MLPGARRRLAYGLLAITPGLWATNYIVGRAAVGVIEPHMMALLRWCFALMLMLPFARRSLMMIPAAWRLEWRQMLVLGALGMWICGAFVYEAARTANPTNMSLLYALAPVMIAASSARMFGERITASQMLGIALAFAGMLFVISKGSIENLAAVRITRGDGWTVIAVISWTIYSLLLRKWQSSLDAFARVIVITFAGLLVLLPFTAVELAVKGLPDFSSPTLWLLVLVAAAAPGFGAYQAYSYMQRELGAAKTGLSLYLGPLWAALLSWAVLSDPPKWYHFAGAALILPGIWFATRAGSPGPRR